MTDVTIPSWLLDKVFVLEYSVNCPVRYMIRLAGKSAVIDRRQYIRPNAEDYTQDDYGFGETIEEAAKNALVMKFSRQ